MFNFLLILELLCTFSVVIFGLIPQDQSTTAGFNCVILKGDRTIHYHSGTVNPNSYSINSYISK